MLKSGRMFDEAEKAVDAYTEIGNLYCEAELSHEGLRIYVHLSERWIYLSLNKR